MSTAAPHHLTEIATQWRIARRLYALYGPLQQRFDLGVARCPELESPINKAEPEVIDRIWLWFDQMDAAIHVHQLRQLLQTSPLGTEENLRAIITRYMEREEKTDADRDKLDFLLVQYLGSCAPPGFYDKEVTFDDCAQALEPVLGEVGIHPPRWTEPLEKALDDLEKCDSLRDLLSRGILEDVRQVKVAAGEMYFGPTALVASTRFNFLARRSFVRMIAADLHAIRSTLRDLEVQGVKIVDCSKAGLSAEESVPHLRELCHDWKKAFHAAYAAGQSFKQLVDVRTTVEDTLANAIAEKQRRDLEEKEALEALEAHQKESEERERVESEARARQAEEERQRAAEEERLQKEEAERLRLEAEEKARKEAEETARREEEERVRQAEEARLRQEEEARLQREAEEKARLEAAETARREEEERHAAAEKARLEAEEQARLAEEERKRREEEAAKLKAEEEAANDEYERAVQEAEAKSQREAEEKARIAAEAKAAEEKARVEAEEKARQEAEELARLAAEAQAAEEKARLEAEEKARLEAEEKVRLEEAARQKQAEHDRLQLEALEVARQQAEAKALAEEADRQRHEQEEKDRKEAEELAELEALIKAEEEAAAKAKAEAEAKQREDEERAQMSPEEIAALEEYERALKAAEEAESAKKAAPPATKSAGKAAAAAAPARSKKSDKSEKAESVEDWQARISDSIKHTKAVGNTVTSLRIGEINVMLSSWEAHAFRHQGSPNEEALRGAVAARAMLVSAVTQRKSGGKADLIRTALWQAQTELSKAQARVTAAREAAEIDAAVSLAATVKRLQLLMEEAGKLK